MKIGNINKKDLAEFKNLGLKYANLQLRISAIIENCGVDLSLSDETEIYELIMAQDELHLQRMKLVR